MMRIYYYEVEDEEIKKRDGGWGLTISEDMSEEEKQYLAYYRGADIESIRQANSDDLLDLAAASGETFEGLLELEDGYYQWQYVGEKNQYGNMEIYGKYKRVGSRRAIVA